MSTLIVVGQIVNVHGIKGAVKIKPYLNNARLLDELKPMTDKSGRTFELISCRVHGDVVIAGIKGVTTRNEAELLKGTELFVPRSVLPDEQNGEFYYCDLVGLTVLQDKMPYGTVTAVQNYGAGDILDIQTNEGRVMSFSFTDAVFPHVDIKAGTIDIIVPDSVNGDVDED